MKKRDRIALLVAAAVVFFLVVPSTAGAQAVAGVSRSAAYMEFSPAGDSEGLVLRVSGQGRFVELRSGAGSSILFGPVDLEGEALPNGNYTWELSAISGGANLGWGAAERGPSDRGLENQRSAPVSLSGYFTVVDGSFANETIGEVGGGRAPAAGGTAIPIDATANTVVAVPGATEYDQVILDDLIVDGSACIGFDCVNGESFGFDTLRLKENNLRIKAQDTSSSASFPSNDWQITFNDSSNGGANKFSIDDIDGGRTPFTIEAGAPSHSLSVDDGGRLGLGTNTPVVDVHIKSGNTPTLRLEQDGSSGFTPQTWDVAGNEANFFVRDATNGSTLPFRIFPGAPSNALNIEASTGDIGIGTTSPGQAIR